MIFSSLHWTIDKLLEVCEMTPIRKIVRNALANVCWEMSGVVLDERTSTHSHIYYVYYSNKHQCIVIEASRIYVCICIYIYTYIRICRLLDGWMDREQLSVCLWIRSIFTIHENFTKYSQGKRNEWFSFK